MHLGQGPSSDWCAVATGLDAQVDHGESVPCSQGCIAAGGCIQGCNLQTGWALSPRSFPASAPTLASPAGDAAQATKGRERDEDSTRARGNHESICAFEIVRKSQVLQITRKADARAFGPAGPLPLAISTSFWFDALCATRLRRFFGHRCGRGLLCSTQCVAHGHAQRCTLFPAATGICKCRKARPEE